MMPSKTPEITWNFLVKTKVGLMVGIVESTWVFGDAYPGTGFFGVTKNSPANQVAEQPAYVHPFNWTNKSVLGIAYYNSFEEGDVISMTVNSKNKTVSFSRNQGNS